MSTFGANPAVAQAAKLFNQEQQRRDGLQVAERLSGDLTTLRESAMKRMIHSDQEVAKDSMLLPTSQLKSQRLAIEEIEALMIAEATLEVRELGCLKSADQWFVDWLTALRLELWNPVGDLPQRVSDYLTQPDDERRLAFSNAIIQALPEARHAPLVLFRLLPPAARLVTALCFDNLPAAESIRAGQISTLPAIAYCRQCQGKVLQDGAECLACGNPMWNQECLCAVDD